MLLEVASLLSFSSPCFYHGSYWTDVNICNLCTISLNFSLASSRLATQKNVEKERKIRCMHYLVDIAWMALGFWGSSTGAAVINDVLICII